MKHRWTDPDEIKTYVCTVGKLTVIEAHQPSAYKTRIITLELTKARIIPLDHVHYHSSSHYQCGRCI